MHFGVTPDRKVMPVAVKIAYWAGMEHGGIRMRMPELKESHHMCPFTCLQCAYMQQREPMQAIVFDDLTQYGYRLASRQKGLNEDHCIVLFNKLAKLHASSMVLLQRSHPSLEDIKEKSMHANRMAFSSYAFLPMVAMKKEDSQDNSIEAFANKDFAAKKVKIMFASNPRTTNTLKFTLKRFDELKLFD
ncbi:hypothetical protein EVAR_69924_1 [Eumeta japonica]|uniref:CHK kinase-like domain-containing protein n=1 Tax=Eumeta variegata TaxID=151549 RepID=A0A4C1SMW4_EUMVA|nr:hypothetical protein EVAR_69924_1 [Eumeta japonica]